MNPGANAAETITLASRLSEIARVPAWLERLASKHGIPDDTRFRMDLCLEEAVSNIIRHGYGGAPHHEIFISYARPRGDTFALIVEDEAPLFNPLVVHKSPISAAPSEESDGDGGRGIPLLKEFADNLEYEPKTGGNRLTICFAAPEFAASTQ